MKLRIKIFIITGSVLGALFLALSFILSSHLSKEFSQLEQDNAQKNIDRLADVFSERKEELSVKLTDWTQWDDMYRFAQDHNDEFIASNLLNETFVSLRVNVIMILDKDRNLIFEKYVDDDGKEGAVPEELKVFFTQQAVLESLKKISDSHQGIMLLDDGTPLMMAAKPITSSDGLAAINGMAVFGYNFEASQAELLSRLTHTSVDFAPYVGGRGRDDFSTAREHLSATKRTYVQYPPVFSNVIEAYGVVDDLNGSPAMILRSGADRSLFNQGLEMRKLFLGVMAAISVLFIGVVFWLFEYLVLRKIRTLSSEVNKINTQENKSMQLSVSGKDEFSQLGNDINKMLETIRSADARKREYIKEIERMNGLMVSRELRMVELKKELAKYKQNERPEED